MLRFGRALVLLLQFQFCDSKGGSVISNTVLVLCFAFLGILVLWHIVSGFVSLLPFMDEYFGYISFTWYFLM